MYSSEEVNLFKALKKSIIFGALPDITLQSILPQLKHIKLSPGQVLFNQGDSSDYVYVVMEGYLSVYLMTPKGTIRSVGVIDPYETLGELGALSGEVRSLTAKAEQKTEIIGIPSDVFKELCTEHPAILLDVIRPIISRALKTIKLYEASDQPEDYSDSDDTLKKTNLSDMDRKLIAWIKTVKLFVGIPDSYLIKLLPYIKRVKLSAGQMLFQQGDYSDYVYVLIHGKLSAFLITTKGERRTIGMIEPGETVGELGILSGFARSLNINAQNDAELIGVPSDTFRQLCQDFSFVLLKAVDPIINRSVQTIKLLIGEKYIENIIFFPTASNVKFELFKNKFSESLKNQNQSKLIADNTLAINEYIQMEKISEQNNIKHHIFFLDQPQEALLQFLTNRVSKFYLVVDGTKVSSVDATSMHILKQASANPKNKLYLILQHPDSTSQPTHTIAWLNKYNFSMHHHIRNGNEADYARLYRFINGTATGLVLGGGGAKGIAHIGVLKALREKNVVIDAIGGTSIGSMAGACYLLQDSFDKFVERFNWLVEKCYQSLSMRHYVWPIVSILSADPATSAGQELFGNLEIENLWLPFFCISSNLSTNQEHIHRTGLIWQALRSSASTPGILPPVVRNGQLHVDGGLLNNLPVDIMRNLLGPSSKIIASKLSNASIDKTHYEFPPVITLKQTLLIKLHLAKDYRFPHYFDMFFNSLLLGSAYKEQLNATAADMIINPDLSKYRTIAILRDDHDKLINLGYNEALKAIEKSIIK